MKRLIDFLFSYQFMLILFFFLGTGAAVAAHRRGAARHPGTGPPGGRRYAGTVPPGVGRPP